MTLIWAALSVALLHAVLPAHWLPYVTVARANGWPVRRLLGVTFVGTLVHLVSTGVLVAITLLLSYGASHAVGHAMDRIGAAMLLVLAALYLFWPDWLARWTRRFTWALAVGVGIAPCVELVPLILVSALSGPAATALVGVTWGAATTALALILAMSGYWGVTLGWTRWLTAHGHVVTGIVLALSAMGVLLHAH